MNKTGVEVGQPHFAVQRERRAQLFERFINLATFVVCLAQQDVQFRSVCTNRNHLFDDAVCIVELSVLQQ